MSPLGGSGREPLRPGRYLRKPESSGLLKADRVAGGREFAEL